MFIVSIAVVGAADLDDPCGLALFPAYANFLNVYGEINLIDCNKIRTKKVASFTKRKFKGFFNFCFISV